MWRHGKVGVSAVLLVAVLAGCGGSVKKPVGPDVRGEALPKAEADLKAAGVGFSEHALNALFGVIVKANWIVCAEKYISPHEVRLDVAKTNCRS